MRHVQLKASYLSAKTGNLGINLNLARKPNGCVIWIWFDPQSMELGPFLWLGGEPGQPLPSLGKRLCKHSKGDSTGQKTTRASIRTVTKGRFETLATMDEVADALFVVRPVDS